MGIDEMLDTITTKDELIKWLINERYIYLRKVSGEIVADNETEMIVDKYNLLKDKAWYNGKFVWWNNRYT